MILRFEPIKVWPEGWPRSSPKWSPFSSSYSNTMKILDRELEHLEARDVLLQVDASYRDIRQDGQLRADAKVRNQGVIVTIETRALGSLVYACDEFEAPPGSGRPHWHENLRAVALGLEALRKVERYGIANRGEQYAGYREIGSGIALGPRTLSVDDALRILFDAAGWSRKPSAEQVQKDPALAQQAYREASKIHHPDQGGDEEAFKLVTEAREVIRRFIDG